MSTGKQKKTPKYLKLIDMGFRPFEARKLAKIPFTKKDERGCRRPSLAFTRMASDRHKLMMKAKKENWSQVQLIDNIKLTYQHNGWLVPKTATVRKGMVDSLDPWAMLRYYKRVMHDEDTPNPRSGSKSHRKYMTAVDKGDIAAQRQREKERRQLAKQAGVE